MQYSIRLLYSVCYKLVVIENAYIVANVANYMLRILVHCGFAYERGDEFFDVDLVKVIKCYKQKYARLSIRMHILL